MCTPSIPSAVAENKTKQNKTKQNKTKQNKTKQNKTKNREAVRWFSYIPSRIRAPKEKKRKEGKEEVEVEVKHRSLTNFAST